MSLLPGGLPSEDPDHETAIDALFQQGGLALPVLGFVAEILVQRVEVPNHIIDTGRIERVVLTGAAAVLAVGPATLVRLSASLATSRAPARPRPRRARAETRSARGDPGRVRDRAA